MKINFLLPVISATSVYFEYGAHHTAALAVEQHQEPIWHSIISTNLTSM